MADIPANDDQEEIAIPPQLISPAALFTAGLMLVAYFSGQTFNKSAVITLGFTAAIVSFAFSHYVPAFKFGRAHAFYLYTYHWLLSFALIFILPTLSYFLYLWVMFMYLAEFLYQAKGMVLSATALLTTMLVGSLYQENGLSKATLIHIAMEFAIIISVNLVMTRLAFGNRKKRAEMQEKIVHAEFEHGRLVALINSMSDGVIATDQNGKIINYNAAALDLLDTNATLTEQQLTDHLQVYDDKDEPVSIMDVAHTTNFLQRRTDLSMSFGEHDKVALDISISRIARSTLLAKQQGYMFLLRDITLQKSLDEERDLFISEVSHELRTPLTIAEGEMSMAVMLTEKPQVEIAQVKESVEKAHDQVVFLEDIVNDLSALSRAQRDDKSMEIETFSVKDVLTELNETYGPQAQKKGLFLNVTIAPSIPELTTSRLYFKEILQNFITNAIKYTDKGGVTVAGQAVDKEHVIISVTDTGAGIAKSEQAKVYQKFWRSEDPYTRSTGGTGLGLFITAKLAQRLGGELHLESKLKEGSTFSLVLPSKAVKDVDKSNVAKNEVAHLFD
ncbi:PAS domain-containing protein [Candidatus Saccharibacteria bacterium]|nr:MAG: PAS domain-containing protein [Candidatus Saccharibacteria bacterium]